MKNASHRVDDTRRAASHGNSPAPQAPVPSFLIENFQRVAYGSKTATFKVRLSHVDFDADLFMPEAKAPFVTPASIRAKYDGAFKRTTRISSDLGTALLKVALRLYEEGE